MSQTPDEWGVEYLALMPSYESFTQRLKVLITDLLDAEGLDYVQIEGRAKAVRSFVEKIQRKGREDENPLRSVMDLAGIRVITYYLEDVDRVIALLRREFRIDEENSVDKAEVFASDQFGYRSSHLVARLSDSRDDLQEWRSFRDFSVEFQVRTALQHAWAAVSHKLDYKSPEEAPTALRRRLFRLSALFEIADEQFSMLRDESSKTEDVYASEVGKGQLDIPIDTSSVDVYLKVSRQYDRLPTLIARHVWPPLHGVSGQVVEESRVKRDLVDLVRVLKDYGIMTLAELERYLNDTEHLELILREFDKVHSRDDSEEGSSVAIEDVPPVTLEDVLTQMIIADNDRSEAPGGLIYTEEGIANLKAVRDAIRQSEAPTG